MPTYSLPKMATEPTGLAIVDRLYGHSRDGQIKPFADRKIHRCLVRDSRNCLYAELLLSKIGDIINIVRRYGKVLETIKYKLNEHYFSMDTFNHRRPIINANNDAAAAKLKVAVGPGDNQK